MESTTEVYVSSAARQLLVRILDGNQNQLISEFYKQPSILFRGLPFYNNFGDNYTVVVSADDYVQAGFTPVKISPNTVQHIDLMLLPRRDQQLEADPVWRSQCSTDVS